MESNNYNHNVLHRKSTAKADIKSLQRIVYYARGSVRRLSSVGTEMGDWE